MNIPTVKEFNTALYQSTQFLMIMFPSSPDACLHCTFQFVSCQSKIVMPAYLTQIIPLPYPVVSCPLLFIDCVCNVVLSLISSTSSEMQQTLLVLQTQMGSLY